MHLCLRLHLVLLVLFVWLVQTVMRLLLHLHMLHRGRSLRGQCRSGKGANHQGDQDFIHQ